MDKIWKDSLIKRFGEFLRYIEETEAHLLPCSLSMILRGLVFPIDGTVIEWLMFLWKHRCAILAAFAEWAKMTDTPLDDEILKLLKELFGCDR